MNRLTKVALAVLISGLVAMCTPVQDFEQGEWIDLTYEFSNETLYWPTAETFQFDTVFAGQTDTGYYYEAYRFCTAEHGGTHLDAPIHFYEGRKAVHELDVDQTIGRAVLIDVSDKALENRDYQIQVEDLEEWENTHGKIPDRSIVLFRTGFGDFWPDPERYLGTDKRGEDALEELSFPGISPFAARWITDNRDIKAVGLDTPSLDYGRSENFETHQILFEQNIPGLENVANLDQLPPTGAYVVALPMKIRDGSGAPVRIVAWLPDG